MISRALVSIITPEHFTMKRWGESGPHGFLHTLPSACCPGNCVILQGSKYSAAVMIGFVSEIKKKTLSNFLLLSCTSITAKKRKETQPHIRSSIHAST